MPTVQNDATLFNPNALNLVCVASYDRLVDAPVVRAWENVMDWEHLPHLHKSTFNYVQLQEAGDWGWRTWANSTHTDHLELTVADATRYVVRSYQSGQQVSEIWTTLTAIGDQTGVHVEFYLPAMDASRIVAVGNAMSTLYSRLWDEDEAMMRERQARLSEVRDRAAEVDLGSQVVVAQSLKQGAKILFQLRGREYQLREMNGELVAHSSICPHLLGPLIDVDISNGRLRCPWHGYAFDLASGECVFPLEASCRLASAPRLVTVDGNVIARVE
jgi:nitrite reductase/ring-hydroxylating ferredoxin subunit